MFKLVALCALFAVAAAEPGLLATPLTYSTIGAPLAYKTFGAQATYYNPIGGYYAPSVYSTPYGYSHLIKKRSAPLAYSSYIAPSTYLASSPLTYSSPVLSSSFYPYSTPYLSSSPFGYAHYIKKSIEHWLKTGRRHSDVLEEQKYSEGRLRRPGATIVLWLKCEQSVHDERLNARVDSMVKEGLIAELLEFHKEHNRQRTKDGTPPDYTKGVFQTLGFKEFHEFLMLPEEERNSEKGKKLLEQGIENTKMATRRYARRQNNMVLGRFLESPRREVPPIFELDTTDVSKWDEEVKNKAIKIIESFLNKSQCPFEPIKPHSREEKEKINSHSSNYCEVCERLIIGDKEFEIHMKSNRHSRALKAKVKLAKLQNIPKDTKE